MDARRAEPPMPNIQHHNRPGALIESRQPHSMLLMATVAGGQAERLIHRDNCLIHASS